MNDLAMSQRASARIGRVSGPLAQIADDLGICLATVRAHAKRAGLSRSRETSR